MKSVQGTEELLTEGVERLEQMGDALKARSSNLLGLISVDVLRAQSSVAIYAPRLAIGGISKVVRGIYHQRRYSQVTGVDFYDAVPDAMDRLEV